MPLYDFLCEGCGKVEEHWFDIAKRDTPVKCHGAMKRLPGGKGMLYYEEGRARTISSLSKDGKPFTSYKQVEQAARAIGATHSGDTVPPSIANNPKSIGMQRYLNSGKQRGKWV